MKNNFKVFNQSIINYRLLYIFAAEKNNQIRDKPMHISAMESIISVAKAGVLAAVE